MGVDVEDLGVWQERLDRAERDIAGRETAAIAASWTVHERAAFVVERDSLAEERDELVVAHDRHAEDLDALALERDGRASARDRAGLPGSPADDDAVLRDRVLAAGDRESAARDRLDARDNRERSRADRARAADARHRAAADREELALTAKLGVQHMSTLQQALGSRIVVGQATGLLMERHGLAAEHAFDMLVQLARESDTKVQVVAERVVTVGEARRRALERDPSLDSQQPYPLGAGDSGDPEPTRTSTPTR
jgi:hypothetical protein